MKHLLCLALVLFGALQVHAEWITDYKAALAKAQSEKKLILINFTGSDWCPPCKLLDEEVFETPTFKTYADKHYVLLRLDYPEAKPQPAALKQQNDDLRQRFGIEAFPTLMVVSAKGRVLGRTSSYVVGSGPDPVIAKLDTFK